MTISLSDPSRYMLLTGRNSAAFNARVSEAISMGFELYGSPAITFNGKDMMVAQAVLWTDDKKSPPNKLEDSVNLNPVWR